MMNTTLSLSDYLALGPLLVLLLLSIALLLLEAFCETKRGLISLVAFFGFAIALSAAYLAPESHSPLLTPWLKFDAFSRFFACFFLGIGLVTTLISSPFFRRFEATRGEYYFFLASSIFGLILISSANDFLTLFLGLETLSIALYVLCSYIKKWGISHEAAFKYFLLGAISTSFLLFGVALIYGAIGTLQFDSLVKSAKLLTGTNLILFTGGIALVTLTLLFKAAVVPFHIWAPDVYAGAPTPVTAFMAVGTKAGAFAALIRIFLLMLPNYDPLWHQLIAWLAYVTLIYANFVALQQVQLRRFFAYSGISHAGFLLIPLASGGIDAAPSMLFYIVVYTLATLGCFAVLAFIDDDSEGVTLLNLKGLFHSSPLLASIFALCLLTLGGIPPTVGFFAKFYLLKVAFTSGYYGLVVVGLLTTILSAFYYLRIVAVMFSESAAKEQLKPLPSKQAAAAGLAASAGILWLSFNPEPLLALFTALSA